LIRVDPQFRFFGQDPFQNGHLIVLTQPHYYFLHTKKSFLIQPEFKDYLVSNMPIIE